MPVRGNVAVPKHLARSKALTSIYATLGGYDPEDGFPSLSALKFIGDVTEVTIPVNRGGTERRELNYQNLGAILEMVPGLVDFEGLTFKRVVTYGQASESRAGGTMLEVCGFDGPTLDYQTHPMLFMLKLPSPNLARFPERRILLDKVWFQKNPLMFSVEDKNDLRIIQEVSAMCGSIREVKSI